MIHTFDVESGRTSQRLPRVHVFHFEGTCDVCGAAISCEWDPAHGTTDYGIEENGRMFTWMRHYATAPEGANPDCAIYSSKVWQVPCPVG